MKQSGHANPFEGRHKRVVVRAKSDALERLRRHRKAAHDTEDLEEFIERQVRDAVEDRDL